MEIYRVTKADLADLFDPGCRISDLFAWLEKDFSEQKKLVCQFVINGQELSESEELDWASKPFEVVNQLEVRVQDEKGLLIEVLDAYIDAMPELIEFIEKKLTTIENGARQFRIKDILEFVKQQEDFVDGMMSLKLPLKRSGSDMSGWDPAEKALHAYVVQCVKHLETKNFVQLIETLEYDGAHVLEMWRQLLIHQKNEVYDPTASMSPKSIIIPKKGDQAAG